MLFPLFRFVLVRRRASSGAFHRVLLQLQSQHPFLRHSRAETRIVRSAEEIQTRHSVRMPLGSAVHAFETVSLAGFPTDAAAIRTALRAVGGGHFD